MTEVFKQIFFGLLWFTLDSALITFWILVFATLIAKASKHD